MKILWISHLIPYPAKGGVLQRAYNLIKEISKQHEIDLLAFNQNDLLSSFYSTEELGKKDAYNHLSELCGRVEFFDIPSENTIFGKYFLALKSLFTSDPYTINWLKSVLFAKYMKNLLSRVDYDLIHFDTISLMPYHTLVGNIPTVLDHHNIESHMLLRRADKENKFIKSWYYRQEGLRLQEKEKLECQNFTLNITCSSLDKERLIEITPEIWVEEIANGVDIEYFSPDYSKQKSCSIIFVGRQNWYPNIEATKFIAFDLWPRIKREFPDLTMDIVGANPPNEIVELSRCDESFNVHGFVDDVRHLINEASIYICPIRDGGGTKLKILDAMAMGKAIISHPIACEGIEVTNGINVIFASNVDEYISSVKRLINDQELRIKIGKSARALAEEKYSFSKIGKKLSDLYMQCQY